VLREKVKWRHRDLPDEDWGAMTETKDKNIKERGISGKSSQKRRKKLNSSYGCTRWAFPGGRGGEKP